MMINGVTNKHHDVLRLVDILGIHMGLVTDSVTETLPSPTPVPEEDLETIIAPVILSGSLDILNIMNHRWRETRWSSLMTRTAPASRQLRRQWGR